MNETNNTITSTNQTEQSKRAKARWAILRNALLSNNNSRSNSKCTTTSSNSLEQTSSCTETNDIITINEEGGTSTTTDNHSTHRNYSIHRFKGFELINRTIIPNENVGCCNGVDEDENNEKEEQNYDIVEYEIPLFKKQQQHHQEFKQKYDKVLRIRTKEKNTKTKMNTTLKELMSHQHYGVDNTGNTRVWECSTILAYLLMSSYSFHNIARKDSTLPSLSSSSSEMKKVTSTPTTQNHYFNFANLMNLARPKQIIGQASTNNQVLTQNNRSRLRVIELGAGMAALPSLSLAALALVNKDSIPFMDITITDGHPKAVKNNNDCTKLTLDLYGSSRSESRKVVGNNKTIFKTSQCSIQTQLLLWKTNEEGVQECQSLLCNNSDDNSNESNENMSLNENTETSSPDYYDVIFVSDCIHFTEFHCHLMATIGRLLRIGGVCILCQPKRGRSLDQFIEMIDEVNGTTTTFDDENDQGKNHVLPSSMLFEKNIYHDYDEEISKQHQENELKNNDLYDANIHYPLILSLKKLREYDEGNDTRVASLHVERRNK